MCQAQYQSWRDWYGGSTGLSKKNSCRNFFIQSTSNHNHMGKAFHPIRNQLSKWISQFAMHSSCCWHLFNLHSLANLRTAEQKTQLIFRKAIACCCLWQNLEWNLDIMQLTTSKTAWLAILNFKSVQNYTVHLLSFETFITI